MRGSCRCNNIEVVWHTVDYSVVPRACQCEYCAAKGAAYVSKSGTAVEVLVRKERLHLIITHGSKSAHFHECGSCGEVVFVTADIDGARYGALNARCMKNKPGFPPSVNTNFSGETAGQKQDRWRRNWCQPIIINVQGSEALAARLPQTSGTGESL